MRRTHMAPIIFDTIRPIARPVDRPPIEQHHLLGLGRRQLCLPALQLQARRSAAAPSAAAICPVGPVAAASWNRFASPIPAPSPIALESGFSDRARYNRFSRPRPAGQHDATHKQRRIAKARFTPCRSRHSSTASPDSLRHIQRKLTPRPHGRLHVELRPDQIRSLLRHRQAKFHRFLPLARIFQR